MTKKERDGLQAKMFVQKRRVTFLWKGRNVNVDSMEDDFKKEEVKKLLSLKASITHESC